jgi:hypothetical protein
VRGRRRDATADNHVIAEHVQQLASVQPHPCCHPLPDGAALLGRAGSPGVAPSAARALARGRYDESAALVRALAA